jgi:hypothetical protein
MLTIVDEFTRENHIIHVDRRIRSCDVMLEPQCEPYQTNILSGPVSVIQPDDPENNMSDKEWDLVIRAQDKLGLTVEERRHSHKSLP